MSVTINVYLVSLALLALSFILICSFHWMARRAPSFIDEAVLMAHHVIWAAAFLLVACIPHSMWSWVIPSVLLWGGARRWMGLRKTLKEITRGSGGDYE